MHAVLTLTVDFGQKTETSKIMCSGNKDIFSHGHVAIRGAAIAYKHPLPTWVITTPNVNHVISYVRGQYKHSVRMKNRWKNWARRVSPFRVT